MTPPGSDDRELDRYKSLLEEAVTFTNIVQWKRVASEWLRENLSNHTHKSIIELMYEHRDQVRQKQETRPHWKDLHKYHFDFVIPVKGISVFIETVFDDGATIDDCIITVVSMHPSSQ
ncbi:MAG: hypothetical protein JW959_15225 [Pirellulales bacterium]|nr:hypothetical protein [Pirellulales bacterium]